MFVALSRLTIILIIAGIAVVAVILGLTLGILLHPCRIATVPTDLAITCSNDGLVQLSWLNSEENADCSVSYKITYILNSGEEVEVKTSEQHYTINPKVLCFDLLVNVWAIGKFGRQSDEYATNYCKTYPNDSNDIPPPLDITLSPSAQGLEPAWTRPLELQTCNVQYDVRITSDTIANQEFRVFSERFTIERRLYCFSIDIYITTVIGEIRSSEYSSHYSEILLPPQLSVIHIHRPENKITFSWKRNELQFQCGLEYKVIYSLLDGEESVYRTWEPTISFDIAYCNTAKVVFYTVGQDVESAGNSDTRIEGLPTRVEPVRNIRINSISKDAVRVLWDSPRYVESCTDIVYAVTATNEDKGITSTCTGNSECEIILEDLCPVTNFTVESSSIRGETTWQIYECSNEDSNL